MAHCPPPVPLFDDEANEFVKLVMEDKWEEVIKKYHENSIYHNIAIKGKGTALHVAISNQSKGVVKNLVEAIENVVDKSCLKIENEIDATPLHLAAYRGSTDMCELIIGKDFERKYLIQKRNKNGETPLFWAVCANQTIVFVYLQQFYCLDLNIAINNNGTSILHVAIRGEMFDLANIILVCYENLGYWKDKNDVTPLEILATRTSAFKSGNRLSWWKKILYYCFTISLHDATTTVELNEQQKEKSEKNAKIEKSSGQVNITFYNVETLHEEYKIHSCYRAQFYLRIQLFLFRCSSLLDIPEIKTIKEKHIYAGEFLKKLMEKPTHAYMGGGARPLGNEWYNLPEFSHEGGDDLMEDSANIIGKDSTFFAVPKSGISEIKEDPNSDKKDSSLLGIVNIKTNVKTNVKNTPYLIAASHGIVEIMSELQSNIKSVINETNSNNENVLLLAVKNRQPHVVQMLLKTLPKGVFSHLIQQIDKNQNTVLHLAADTPFQREHSWMVSGPAMQMMWDIKWYKYIKEIVPDHFHTRENIQEKTPSEIFKEQRTDLLQESVEWLKETMTSCSVVASLIAGVAYASMGSVPGGNKETGEPALQGKPAFEGFAISSLIGLYFSVTALMIFLAILTSRKEIEDFHKTLPMKLLFGLSSLFVSIVAMFASFSAGHFSILTDKYTKGGILFYLYISICVSVAFYAVVQFTLVVDLFYVIFRYVPPPTVKGVHL